MPTNHKTTARTSRSARKAPSARASSGRPRAGATALSRIQQNDRVIARVKRALEATQKDLSGIRGSVSAGGRDLRKDVTKLLRDARRDVEKMNTAVRRDLERLQKDLSAATKAQPRKPTRKPARGARSSSR
jgi:hypothetical protein